MSRPKSYHDFIDRCREQEKKCLKCENKVTHDPKDGGFCYMFEKMFVGCKHTGECKQFKAIK